MLVPQTRASMMRRYFLYYCSFLLASFTGACSSDRKPEQTTEVSTETEQPATAATDTVKNKEPEKVEKQAVVRMPEYG